MCLCRKAMIPCMMLVLGGNLAKGPGRTDLGLATLVGITLTRLLFLPLLGLGWVRVVDWLGFLPPADPMFRFVLLLQFATPTAINLGTACLPFCRFAVLLLRHSAILAFCHFRVSPFSHSTIPPFCCFVVTSFCRYAIGHLTIFPV